MKLTSRARRATLATTLAIVIGGGGFAAGTAASDSPAAAQPASVPTTTGARSAVATDSYAGAVRSVLPSVVLIRTASGLGSGVVLDHRGNIVTNAHVAGDATRFQVQLTNDPTPRPAKLVGSYPGGDLAVIRVDDASGLTPATFADSGQVQAGDVVLAVGNPLGLSASVTQGIVSATGRVVSEPATAGTLGTAHPGTTLPGTIQTSAPINPGNSGGALVNTAGAVLGIPTLAATSAQGGGQAQGIGFAIASNTARDIASQLIKSGHVTNSHRAALGARVATAAGADGQPAGVGVAAVTQGGPADRAGLEAGDILTQVGATPTPDTTALAQALASDHPGQSVTVTFVRDGQHHTAQVTLGTLPGA
ncbi:MAG TPA: trypsin-like peptidase domain-containing protein [Streptosporangiaceae bacterium]|jgi:S1-C subfamily serine protease|nr:trypsin-like peptidase domain-containing protein [Streptosporangiaceae bacterium]